MFKVFLHYAYNHPNAESENVFVQLGRIYTISISPTITYATKSVRRTNIKQRNCLFSNEQQMNYVAQYSHNNCKVSCRIHLIRNMCGCTPWFYYMAKG